MKFSLLFAFIASATIIGPAAAQDCGSKLVCEYVLSAPTLDANVTEWDDVAGLSTDLLKYTGPKYDEGQASYKCLYDDTDIYFALEVPGRYRFNATDNHKCAAIGTMMKIGADATFMDMGGCPDVIGECDAVPDTCDTYRVDVGAHWELATTEQGTMYGMEPESGTGNDLVANKDDECAVNSFCRFDDDGEGAGNEWSGAWAHSNPTEGEDGTYTFELSRLLQTGSPKTDNQLASGGTYSFGIAFWDPYDNEDSGWSAPGHYLTGCGTSWIDLELAEKEGGGSTGEQGGDSAGDSDDGSTFKIGATVFIGTAFLGLSGLF
jgi:hypothetical protein